MAYQAEVAAADDGQTAALGLEGARSCRTAVGAGPVLASAYDSSSAHLQTQPMVNAPRY